MIVAVGVSPPRVVVALILLLRLVGGVGAASLLFLALFLGVVSVGRTFLVVLSSVSVSTCITSMVASSIVGERERACSEDTITLLSQVYFCIVKQNMM